jgi:hypothetical protein
MPNHVYSIITVGEEYNDKLKEIAKVGLCKYYKPMPEELNNVKAPNRDLASAKELTKKYGHGDWYSWSNANWGTKWGCYDGEYDDGLYRFTTAWGAVKDDIIQMLLKDIPTLTYQWEEEQGYGMESEYFNGEQSNYFEWDLPNFDETDNDEIQFLTEDYQNGEGCFKKGYYSWSLDEYLGDTYEEALKELNMFTITKN